jgi:hypothetical protein
MIEITKRVYEVNNEEITFQCPELEIEVELFGINGQITHEVGCGYEANLTIDAISIYDKNGNVINDKIDDIEGLKEELAENMIVEYGNLMIDADECKILGNFLRD